MFSLHTEFTASIRRCSRSDMGISDRRRNLYKYGEMKSSGCNIVCRSNEQPSPQIFVLDRGKNGTGCRDLQRVRQTKQYRYSSSQGRLPLLSTRRSKSEEAVSSVLHFNGYDRRPFAMPLLSLSQRQGITEWRSLMSPKRRVTF